MACPLTHPHFLFLQARYPDFLGSPVLSISELIRSCYLQFIPSFVLTSPGENKGEKFHLTWSCSLLAVVGKMPVTGTCQAISPFFLLAGSLELIGYYSITQDHS